MPADQPGELVAVCGDLHRRAVLAHAQQLADIFLDVAERLALGRTKADRTRAGRLEVGAGLQRQRRTRQGEQVVQVRRYRLGPPEQGVQEAHPSTYFPSCFEIFSSSASRRSSDGWVEKIVAMLFLPGRTSRANENSVTGPAV